MIDEYGGILTGGLLGNPILGQYSLSFATVDFETTHPDGISGIINEHVSLYSNFTGWVKNRFSGGGGSHGTFQPHKTKHENHIIISIRLGDQIVKKRYKISDRVLTISINILNKIQKKVTVNASILSKTSIKPTVRIKND